MNIVIEKNKYGVIKENDIKASISADMPLSLADVLANADAKKLKAVFYNPIKKNGKPIEHLYREQDGTIREAKKSELVAAGVESIPSGKKINSTDDDYEDKPLNHWKIKDGKPFPCPETESELLAEKIQRREKISREAFIERHKVYPDYKLQNASLGVYGEQEKKQAVALVQAYRSEYDRCSELISKAQTTKEVREVLPAWPTYPYGK